MTISTKQDKKRSFSFDKDNAFSSHFGRIFDFSNFFFAAFVS